MAVVAAPPYVAADMLCSLGLGFLLAVSYDLASFFLGRSKTVRFFLDVLAGFLAAVLLCSFAAGRSYSGQVRWYMTGALAAGMWGYFSVLAPATRAAQQVLVWLLGRPFALVHLLIVKPLKVGCSGLWHKMTGKIRKIARKHHKKQLKKQSKMLYNSNN